MVTNPIKTFKIIHIKKKKKRNLKIKGKKYKEKSSELGYGKTPELHRTICHSFKKH